MSDDSPSRKALQTTPPDESDLVHMLYDAVIDNSLWPEMVSELIDYIERTRGEAISSEMADRFNGLVQHFQRAVTLSENFVELQERHSTLNGVLNTLALGISIFDHKGRCIYANERARNTRWGEMPLHRLRKLGEPADGAGTASNRRLPSLVSLDDETIALVPADTIANAALPPNVSYIAIALPGGQAEVFESLRQRFYLSDAELRLLRAFHQNRKLRKAADACGLTYESARTYLKRIYSKTGVRDQAALLAILDLNPVSIVGGIASEPAANDGVRKRFQLSDGRSLEYFDLGPPDGQLLLHFDALTGVAIDVLGTPSTYLSTLKALKLRLIVPCRPGTFGSDFKRLSGLSQAVPDVVELMDHLRGERAILLSQAFGSCSALAFAACAPERVERVVLCAPSFPRHEPPNWRKMDVFYIISGVIGRRAPTLMQAIIPFLMRSVMQNTEQYLQRHIARSKCPADIAVLSSPQTHKRIPQMLAQRSTSGTAGLVQENFLNTHGWDFDLARITAPVDILQGALDNVSDPAGSAKLARALPNARLHLFGDLGQYLIFTEWPWVFELCAGRHPAELDAADHTHGS